ncbi:magnesium transporter [Chlamydiota bacterium]
MRIDTTKRISHRDLEAQVSGFTEECTCSFHVDQTVEEVQRALRERQEGRKTEYFYIVDAENVLQGLITLVDLLYSPPEVKLKEIMDREVVAIRDDEMLEKGLKLLSHHQLLILPVINENGELVGVLEIIPGGISHLFPPKKIHYKNLKEDIFQFIGFSIEQRKWNSPWAEYRLRMPWLLCNLVGGLICAVISEFFKLTLEQFVILAFFIPLVLTLSESISIQSMTLSLRFLHVRKVHWGQVGKRALVEMRSSLMLGFTSAVLISLFYFAWSVDLKPIMGIGLSVIMAMVFSALFGALFPIVLHSMRLDPKVAAGPVVLMMADVLTIALYLGLNTFILLHFFA